MNEAPKGPQESQAEKPRGKPSEHGRFIWQTAFVFDKIAQELGAGEAVYGIAVYVALTRIALDAGSPAFEANIAKIAGMVRASYPKVMAVLNSLAETAKVIRIDRRERLPGDKIQPCHRFTLLAVNKSFKRRTRLNAVKPARLNGPGLTNQAQPGSEIYKDVKDSPAPSGREKDNTKTAIQQPSAFALEGQGGAAIADKAIDDPGGGW